MDVADAHVGRLLVKDDVALRCQKLFADFLDEWVALMSFWVSLNNFSDLLRFKEDGELKYLKGATELTNPDRFTLDVNFDDIEKYNQYLSTTIIEEYYRLDC